MEEIGKGARCIALHDNIHIFGGFNNYKHMVYRTKENEIKILDDPTTTSNIVYGSVVKFENQIMRFGGWNCSTKEYMDALFISSSIKPNTYNDIEWIPMPSWKCKRPVSDCGYAMYK
eukprot:758610_1